MNFVKLVNQLKLMLFVGLFTLTGQFISSQISPFEALPGMLLIIAVATAALMLKEVVPLRLPAFAWATLLGFLLTLPPLPFSSFVLEYTNRVGFLATTTPILAFAGISVGNKIGILREISWKLVVIALVVFISTFFGSATIAHIVLKLRGLI